MTGSQRGQTLVIFTLVAAFILIGTIALVGNVQVLYVNYDRADGAALLAAQAGASAVDQGALYQDVIQLDQQAAHDRCVAAGSQVPNVVNVQCTVAPFPDNTVTATVVEQVEMPMPFWASTETLQATRSAKPAFGGSTGRF